MEKFLLFKGIIRTIQGGAFFAAFMGWIVKIIGIALIIPVILLSISIWQIAGIEGQPVEVVIYAILAQVILLATYYFLFNLLWLRGQDIKDLPLSLEYNATPVIVLLIKTVFEFLATIMLVAGLLMTLAMWLSPSMMYVLGPFMAASTLLYTFENNFLAGVVAFLLSGVVSIFLLVYGYFMAEIVGALVAIARNTKKGK